MTLTEIFTLVAAENARSKEKHGSWVGLPHLDQADALRAEMVEWKMAYYGGDIHGEHGEIAELLQVMNLCARRIMVLEGEPDA